MRLSTKKKLSPNVVLDPEKLLAEMDKAMYKYDKVVREKCGNNPFLVMMATVAGGVGSLGLFTFLAYNGCFDELLQLNTSAVLLGLFFTTLFASRGCAIGVDYMLDDFLPAKAKKKFEKFREQYVSAVKEQHKKGFFVPTVENLTSENSVSNMDSKCYKLYKNHHWRTRRAMCLVANNIKNEDNGIVTDDKAKEKEMEHQNNYLWGKRMQFYKELEQC